MTSFRSLDLNIAFYEEGAFSVLSSDLIILILGMIPLEFISIVRRINRRWRLRMSDERIWRRLYLENFEGIPVISSWKNEIINKSSPSTSVHFEFSQNFLRMEYQSRNLFIHR